MWALQNQVWLLPRKGDGADKIYYTRANRQWLKDRHIKLAAKNGYGMNRIRARLRQTSQSWIASIILVLNLVKLAGQVPYCLGFSARTTRFYKMITPSVTTIGLWLIILGHQAFVRPVSYSMCP